MHEQKDRKKEIQHSYYTFKKNSELHEIYITKITLTKYHMYHQVHRKNEGFLGKSCSMAQKAENFCQEMPGFNSVLQMTVSCSEIKLHGFVRMKILQQL